ncbi:MAG: hypothetical protein ABI638_02640 [Ignavibacteriota bacterium]
MRNILFVLGLFFVISIFSYSQQFGVGIHSRLFPSVTKNTLNNNIYQSADIDNYLLTGLFVSFKTGGNTPWKFSLKYSFGQKDVTGNKPQLNLYEPTKILDLYSFDLSVCYMINLSPKFKFSAGVMPGYYIAKLTEKYNDEKIFYEYKFNLTPIIDASYEVYDKLEINVLLMYSLEKYRIVKNYSYSPGGYQQIISGFDEFDFSGMNFGLAVTYWVDL